MNNKFWMINQTKKKLLKIKKQKIIQNMKIQLMMTKMKNKKADLKIDIEENFFQNNNYSE